MSKAQIHLVIDSTKLSLLEINGIIGIDQNEGWNLGDAYTIAGKKKAARFSRWSLFEQIDDESSIDEAARMLVQRLRPVEHRFRALPAETRVALSMYITESHSIFGFGLDAEVMRFFSDLNAELDVSVVVRL
jgi:hypothetical protein